MRKAFIALVLLFPVIAAAQSITISPARIAFNSEGTIMTISGTGLAGSSWIITTIAGVHEGGVPPILQRGRRLWPEPGSGDADRRVVRPRQPLRPRTQSCKLLRQSRPCLISNTGCSCVGARCGRRLDFAALLGRRLLTDQ